MTLLLVLTLKVSAVLAATLTAAALLRAQSAAVRHWVLAAGITCAALLPAFIPLTPRWSLPATDRFSGEPRPDVVTASATAGAAARPLPPAAPDRRPALPAVPDLTLLIVPLWLLGSVTTAGVLGIGMWRLRRIAASATPVIRGPWADAAAELAHDCGITRPVRILQSTDPALLVTWGLRRPTVMLPLGAATWSEERIRIVLAHELAHIRRGDWAIQLMAEGLRAALWFNPLVWIACRRLRHESEQACDDTVLEAGVSGPAYAAQLLDLARTFASHRRTWSPALPVARPSGLERRVRAMLNGRLNRQPLTPFSRVVIAAAVLGVTVVAAGAGALAQTFATLSGSLSDPSGAALPGASVSATNVTTHARTIVKSARSGAFEFTLPPGDYLLEANVPGFQSYRAPLTLDGQLVERSIVLDVGTLEETITVTDDPSPARPADARRVQELEEQRAKRTAQTCTPSASAPGERPVGGNIRPPLKLRHVAPVFPPALRGRTFDGSVMLEARIGRDGFVNDVRADPMANPDLAAAAMDAVRQWHFSETLLNCLPIEVVMTVSVSFKTAP